MNTGHTHNEGDLYADDIHDAEFQDAEIIDEEIHDNPTAAQEASYAQEEPQVVEAQVQEETENQDNNTQAEFAEKQAEAERQASDAAQADDFDRALVEISKSEDENLLRGVELIHSKLLSTLRSKGLEQIPVAASDTFDSDIHEALTQTTAPTPELKGKIIDVVEKGYKLGEKIIRYPKVVVGQ